MGTGTVIAILALSALGAGLALWLIPKAQVNRLEGLASPDSEAGRKFELRNEARKTLAQILGGLAFLTTVFFTYQSVTVSQKAQDTAQIAQDTAREGQITERFTRAVDQLGATDEDGEEALEVRLGGIYALERIAKDSDKDWFQVMEILSAYVRKNAPVATAPVATGGGEQQNTQSRSLAETEELLKAPPADIQAILTVLGRKKIPESIPEDSFVSDLHESNLDHANLFRSHLQRANLVRSNLQGAQLTEANLKRSVLWQANLVGANLTNAKLEYADLKGADLRGTIGLEQPQVDKTFAGDQTTQLPTGITPPSSWGKLVIPDGLTLPPKEYYPDKFELMHSLRVDEGWMSAGQGRDYLFLVNGRSSLNFIRVQNVYDEDDPTGRQTRPVPEDLVDWFQDHPHLSTSKLSRESYEGVSASEFYALAESQPGTNLVDCLQPCVPLFSYVNELMGQQSSFVLFDEAESRIVVLDIGGEEVVVTMESPTDELGNFLPKAKTVLETVRWETERR